MRIDYRSPFLQEMDCQQEKWIAGRFTTTTVEPYCIVLVTLWHYSDYKGLQNPSYRTVLYTVRLYDRTLL